MDYLNKEKDIYYDKHIDLFDLHHYKDVISLSVEDCKKLIPILTEFVR